MNSDMDRRRAEPVRRANANRFSGRVLGSWAISGASIALLCGTFAVQANDRDSDNERDRGASRAQLRNFIGQQVGGIEKLMVPARNADIPVPPGPAAEPYRYETTEAKRFLGKMLFHDPVRTTRININEAVPVNLPAGTAFGGTVDGSNPNVQAIVNATRQTGGCGTCHFGEAASKAGQVLNLHVGAEGRGYTDENGKFIVRRRTQEILVKKRTAPIFPGDTLVDALPTLTDIDIIKGERKVTTPAPFYHPELGAEKLLATGRLDELDSVGRMSMSVIGFAFNNRLLFGGLAGEPPSSLGGINPLNAPNGDPAGENIALLLLDAHRMLGTQSEALRSNPVFVKLFRDAFPREAAAAGNDLTKLIDDQTVLRATATFMRTVVTRNTPFDRFIAGNGDALSPAQRRGARLFYTKATEGGAGCVACHSGPMLNKQVNDPDVAGIGQLLEENFINIGIGDHPAQALNAEARGRLDRTKLGRDGFPYHAEDTGRQEITGNPDHAFKFRSLTLRQLRDGGNFMHNASFSKVRDVVEYFNAGVAQDPTAGAAHTLDKRFTSPRGPGYPVGLGLSKRQVDDLTDFLENGLYDPAFRDDDPNSTTDRFQPSKRDLTYSKYRPDLAALGAKDGFMPSGLAINNNDPLSRRDQGLEFLDVTSQAVPSRVYSDTLGNRQLDVYKITNNGTTVVDTHLLTVVRGLPRNARLANADGTSKAGDPYLRLFLNDGVLQPGQSAYAAFAFTRPKDVPRLNYTLELLSGQGKP